MNDTVPLCFALGAGEGQRLAADTVLHHAGARGRNYGALPPLLSLTAHTPGQAPAFDAAPQTSQASARLLIPTFLRRLPPPLLPGTSVPTCQMSSCLIQASASGR